MKKIYLRNKQDEITIITEGNDNIKIEKDESMTTGNRFVDIIININAEIKQIDDKHIKIIYRV